MVQSSAQKLPPEILGIIFQYACPRLEFSQSFQNYDQVSVKQSRQHFSFATVSSTWRYAVYATPQLWTSVILSHEDTQLVELYVAGSRSFQVALELHNPLPRLASQPCGGGYVLSKVAFKLESLTLVNLEDNTLDYLSTLEFPALKRIGILSKGYRRLSRLTVRNTPVLQHLSLHALPYFNTFRFELPWSSITSLHFKCVPISICMQSIVQCRNLIEFHCHGVYRTQDREFHLPETLLTLPYLNLFHCFAGRAMSFLLPGPFRHLRMRALQSLGVGWDFENRMYSVWNDFFRELPQTLQRLQFHSFHARAQPRTAQDIDILAYPECLLEHTPYLHELNLDQCSRPFIDDLFAALSLYDSLTGDPIYLPVLRALVITNFFPPLDVGVPDATREMVKKRFAGQIELPTFSISVETREGASNGENQRMTLVLND